MGWELKAPEGSSESLSPCPQQGEDTSSLPVQGAVTNAACTRSHEEPNRPAQTSWHPRWPRRHWRAGATSNPEGGEGEPGARAEAAHVAKAGSRAGRTHMRAVRGPGPRPAWRHTGGQAAPRLLSGTCPTGSQGTRRPRQGPRCRGKLHDAEKCSRFM